MSSKPRLRPGPDGWQPLPPVHIDMGTCPTCRGHGVVTTERPAHPPASPTAHDLLGEASDAIVNRGAQRDTQGAERSMARTVATFNALTGADLTEREGWIFMVALKLSRAQPNGGVRDDYVDCAAYAALAGECACRVDAP